MIEPNKEYVNSWGVYTCLDYCADGYYKKEDSTCGACDGRCSICEGTPTNCLYCLYANDFTDVAPGCLCLKGSK